MMEIKEKKTITVIIVLLLAIWFYWFQWRPMQIRNYCDQVAWNEAENKTYDPYWKNWRSEIDEKVYDWKYTQCLHSRGLK